MSMGATLQSAGANRSAYSAEPEQGTSPLRKAALLVVSLEEPLARDLVALLDRADVDALNLELTRLGSVGTEEQQSVLREFLALAMQRSRFTFDDVAGLSESQVRAAYQEDEAEVWVLALAGASRGARLRVLSALPFPAADGLRRELAALGPFRLDDVETAQARLCERFRRTLESPAPSRGATRERPAGANS